MGPYEIVLTGGFLILSVVFVLRGVKACARAGRETDAAPRKNFRRKALVMAALALAFLLCALYVIFRISWLMMIVFLMGTVAIGYVISSGVVANMREH